MSSPIKPLFLGPASAKRGKWNGGWVPIGYEYDRATQQLQPAPDEGDLICDMYQLAVKFRNATEVAKILNETGKRTRQRVLVRADGSQRVVGEKRFIGDRVKAILSNPIWIRESSSMATRNTRRNIRLWCRRSSGTRPTKRSSLRKPSPPNSSGATSTSIF